MGQQFIATTRIGPTEIEHHTVNWAEECDLTDDKIVAAEFDFDNPQLKIQWENYTDTDTTLCINANGVAPGKYFAGHTVYLESGRKLRRTILVRVVQR
ncbi:hypothetical protein ORI20_14125 [Mycobacterium sp. CVI_P3]|uniref:Uncharacterized protein n=1 Tax=Mycobacterium pinniadriaticum TaxID=2994102 RepID=A0ABT3SEM9_9MYCO|nr:hypothetical protein [Mycobacterium pinniadriaticum]MCX2931418.1 hypothetical protein [Mycobacterium pinniadriaticum]MCX2937842.1 hypothetical protein [Mycobacterium pinniadriaticum]